jgi:hypothetical protein
MRRRRLLAVLGATGLTAGLLSAAVAQPAGAAAGAALPASARGAILGHLHVGPAKRVVVRTLPQTRAGLNATIRPPLGRNGKPAGSGLPSRPARGVKPAGGHTPIGALGIDTRFDGINSASSSCSCQPPDATAAVGPNDILELANLEFADYDKTGHLNFETSLNTFLNTADPLTQPRVLYDPTWNRWQITVNDTASDSLWLVFSATNNPLSGWWYYHVTLGFPAGDRLDYPEVGMNDVSYFFTTNNYDSSNTYLNSTSFSLPKSRVYNGFGWGAGLGGVAFGTTPAIVGGYPTQQTNFTYMLAADDANNLMYVYAWSNTAEVPHLAYKGAIAYSWAAPSRQVNQPGSNVTLDPLDGRLDWSVAQISKKVWFTHGVDIGGFPAVNYGYVQPANMSIHVGTAYHTVTSDDFNPSISVGLDSAQKPVAVLNWAYTDSGNGVATTDVFAVTDGGALPHKSGTPYSTAGGVATQSAFGAYSSVAPEYDAVGSCAPGEEMLVTNEYFASDGSWKTRLARVHGTC